MMKLIIHHFIISFLGLFFVLTITHAAQAAAVYKWRDDSGKLHITDNPANVPEKYRETHIINLKDLSPSQKFIQSKGETLWNNNCKSCHFIGTRSQGDGSQPFGARFLIPQVSIEDFVSTLRHEITQNSEMEMVNVNDDELTEIGKYIIKEAEKIQP